MERLLTKREKLGSGNFLKSHSWFQFLSPPTFLVLESPISMFYFFCFGPISLPHLALLFSNISFSFHPLPAQTLVLQSQMHVETSLYPSIYLCFPPALPPFLFLYFAFFSCAQRGSRLPGLVCRRVYSN